MSQISKLIGEQIRTFRQSRGLSQEQLALRANLNTTFLGQVERGIKKPTIDTIEKIVIALDISFEDIFNFDKNIPTYKDTGIIDKIAFELNGRSHEEQQAVYNFVKQILEFKDKK
ncbi:helix-turn-helix domain-containing protein [Desnuesiella massiliensis]|uniref:helix-turn-helix domain-containing protein n=1 Tax=Desnuesiella massiliensis TaxID=1650662 RepID=UPI0006E3AA0F|nr:helix-turn-helix transcriptional regulator [Desnuesiella massiliensis]